MSRESYYNIDMVRTGALLKDMIFRACAVCIIFSQTSLSIRPSAALDFLAVATAAQSKIRLAYERISCGVSRDIMQTAH